MTRYSKIALGFTAAFGLLVGHSVAAAQEGLPEAAGADPVTVSLDGAASGTALIQQTEEGQTALELEVHGVPATEEPLVAVLATGTCEAPGEIRAALGTVVRGEEGDAHGHFLLADPIDAVVGTPTVVQIQAEGVDANPISCGQFGPAAADEPFGEPATAPIPDPIPADDLDEAEDAEGIIDEDIDVDVEAEEPEAEEQD